MILTLSQCARRCVQQAALWQPEFGPLLAAALIFLRLVTAEAKLPLFLREPTVSGGRARLSVIFKSKSPADEYSVNTPACAGARITQPVMVLTLGNDSNLKAL